MAVIASTAAQAASAGGDTTMEALTMLGVLVVALGLIVLGIRCWRGHELGAVAEYERTTGRWPWSSQGSLRKYRTMMGASYLNTCGAAGFALMALADLVRLAAGRGHDWWPWQVATVSGFALIGIAFLAINVYLLVGLPDALRPPCQRGWKEVHGRLVLVRPGTTEQEREQRRPIGVDPVYRDMVAQRRARREAHRRDPWADDC